MERLLTNAQMRSADEYTINKLGVSSQTLMCRAGICIAEEVKKVAEGKSVTVVCGTGNNGGDGFVCAELLRKSNFNVKVYALDGNLSSDCAREKSAYKGEYTDSLTADIIIDCIFGTGLSRDITGKIRDIIEAINKSGAYVISADIPSGINGDSGEVCGCAVRANLTVAIAEYKLGHFLGDGIDYCGGVVKKDIGITCPDGAYALTCSDADIKKFFPERKHNSHKGSYGSANIIAGSEKYLGAAALAVCAALKSGCGYVKLTAEDKVKFCLAPKYPQVIYLEQPDLNSNAIAIGMGCGVSSRLYEEIKGLLKEYKGTLIIDADGLNSISKYGVEILRDKSCEVILTPHVKEFSRLTQLSVGEILKDPVKRASEFAKSYGVTVLLKSAVSVICDGENTILNMRGSTALSKGGSGDMLSGYICGCAARGLKPLDTAVCASYTMGVSAEMSSAQKTDYCATAKDILENLHFAVMRLTK